jgi:quinol monooxygenase YgiN
MSTSAPLKIIAIATALPEKEKALRTAQATLVAETIKEPGCLHFELYQSLETGRVLIFVESWASEPLWRAHMNGAAIGRFQASGGGSLIQDFVLHRAALVADGSE